MEYFTNAGTYRYLLNCIMIIQHDLPGVFSNAIYLSTVNGSLWTLPVEIICNIICYCVCQLKLFTLQKKRKIILTILIIGSIPLLFCKDSFTRAVLRPCLLFGIGILYEMYHEKIVFKAQYVWLALGGLIISTVVGLLDIGMLILFPYIMMALWFGGGGNALQILHLPATIPIKYIY